MVCRIQDSLQEISRCNRRQRNPKVKQNLAKFEYFWVGFGHLSTRKRVILPDHGAHILTMIHDELVDL